MPAHYFQCTDGFDLVLDRHGCDLEDEGEVRRMAARTAIELMQRLPRYNGWTSWLVSVHDEDGFLIDTVLFTDCRAERANVRVQREPAISRSRTELCTRSADRGAEHPAKSRISAGSRGWKAILSRWRSPSTRRVPCPVCGGGRRKHARASCWRTAPEPE